MKQFVAAAVVAVVVSVSGCGNESNRGRTETGSPSDTQSGAPVTSVIENGVHHVGVDIPSGVYTATGTGCLGFTASNADFKIEDDLADPDAYLAGAIRVGDVQRIMVHDGEFFTSLECDGWQREDVGGPTSPDPATLAGGCKILVGGDDLVQDVVSFLGKPTSAQDSAFAYKLQDRLMAPVEARNRSLANPAGQLVDSLDDPSAYVTADGDLTRDVARAVARIRSACRSS